MSCSSGNTDNDKRQYPRFPVNIEVHYADDSLPKKLFTSTGIKNISLGGICLYTFEKVEPGTVLIFSFTVPAVNRLIIVKGKVIWAHNVSVATKEEEIFEVGVEFINLSDEDRKILVQYSEEHKNT